jgi:hypothetical protein
MCILLCASPLFAPERLSRNPEIGLPDNHPCGLNSAEQYRTALLLYAPWVTLGLCF